MGILEKVKRRLNLTRSQYIAVGITVAFFLITIFVVVPSMNEWVTSNNELEEGRSFPIDFAYNFDGAIGVPWGERADVELHLTVNYPHGTLIVDDLITIDGVANANPVIPQYVESILIHFQNALDENLSRGADLKLNRIETSNIFNGTAKMAWAVEGSYQAYLSINFWEDGSLVNRVAQSPDVSLTVYPKYQYAQIVNNNASMTLAISVYLLTLIGLGELVLSLWDRDKKAQNHKQDSKDGNSQTNIRDNISNKRTIRKANKNNPEPYYKHRKKHKK